MTKKITNKRFHGVPRGFTGFHGVSQKILIYLILKIIGVYFDTRKFQSAVSCFPTDMDRYLKKTATSSASSSSSSTASKKKAKTKPVARKTCESIANSIMRRTPMPNDDGIHFRLLILVKAVEVLDVI